MIEGLLITVIAVVVLATGVIVSTINQSTKELTDALDRNAKR